MDLDKPINK